MRFDWKEKCCRFLEDGLGIERCTAGSRASLHCAKAAGSRDIEADCVLERNIGVNNPLKEPLGGDDVVA